MVVRYFEEILLDFKKKKEKKQTNKQTQKRKKNRKRSSFAGGWLTFLKLGSTSVGFGGCVCDLFGKPRVAKSLLFQHVAQSSLHAMIYPNVVFFTCSVCLLMMGSECMWAFGEGSSFS